MLKDLEVEHLIMAMEEMMDLVGEVTEGDMVEMAMIGIEMVKAESMVMAMGRAVNLTVLEIKTDMAIDTVTEAAATIAIAATSVTEETVAAVNASSSPHSSNKWLPAKSSSTTRACDSIAMS